MDKKLRRYPMRARRVAWVDRELLLKAKAIAYLKDMTLEAYVGEAIQEAIKRDSGKLGINISGK